MSRNGAQNVRIIPYTGLHPRWGFHPWLYSIAPSGLSCVTGTGHIPAPEGGEIQPGVKSPGQGRSPCDLSTNGAAAEIPLITFSLSRRNSKYAEEPLPGHGLRSSPQQDWQIATCSHNIPAHRCASPENGAAIPSQMTSLNPAISRNGDRNQ